MSHHSRHLLLYKSKRKIYVEMLQDDKIDVNDDTI